MTIAEQVGHDTENNLEHFGDVLDHHLDARVYINISFIILGGWVGNPRLLTILKKKYERKLMQGMINNTF